MDATVTPALFSFALSVVVHALAGDGGATTAFGKALASLLGEYTGAKGGAAIDKLTRQIAGNLQSANLDPKDSGDLERALRRAYWESILHALMLAAERAGIEVKSPRPPLAFWIARRWEDICSRPQPLNLGPAPVQQVVEDLAKRIEKPDDYREDLPGNINLAAVAEQLLQAGGAQTLSLQCGDHAWSYLEKRIRIWPDLKATFDANWSLCFCHAFQYHFKSETTVYRIVTGQLLTGIDRRLHTLDSRTAELVRGLKRMPTRCDGQIKDFIHYYLGSESRPAPFGGRGWELERLSRWLDDRNAKPYLLVTAPGGRGKSALLAHWASDLSARLGVDHLIYFPVSARYQTNSESTVFSALAAHVNAVNGEGDLGRADAWQYRSIFRDLIEKAPKDGGRVVLVLDGLDEAGWDGWEGVLPAEAPQHLRVMVAARPLLGDSSGEPWIRRLGWEPRDVECIELPLLDVDGVREVLRAMGDPLSGLAIEVDVPGNIHRLSDGGDPLLVGEFVKLLREKAAQPDFRPEQVPQMRPGLKGIFESWLEHQRRIWKQLDSGFKLEAEPRALMVLHLCSFALGPLSLEDMEALAPDQFTSRTGLKAAVRSTERFLAGSLDTGLVFTHPRFGEYWRDQMGDRERAEVQRRFSEYAAGHLRALHASGGKPSEYLVRWAVRHLEQSGELPEFGCLVASVPWFREWQELEGTPSGFLTDLERIERFGENTAAQSKIPLWMRVRTALFRSSILTSERQIPLELFEKAIDAEVLSYPLAKVLAREQYDENRGLYLSVVLRYSPVEEREDLLAEALEAARTTLDESSRSQALSSLASSLIGDLRKEVLSEALRTARAIENEFDRSQALSTMAGSLSAYPDLMAEALSAAWAISYKSDRSQALSAMAGSLSGNLQQEVLTGALSAARAIGDESERSRALSAVARSLCGELQQEVLAEALRAAQGVGDGSDRSLALSALARSLSAYPDLMAEALSAARDIGDESERSRSLSALAGSLSGSLQKEVLAEALRAAQAIGDGFDRSQPLSAMARSLAAHPDLLAEVLRAARAVGNEFGRSLALSALAGSLSGNLQKEVLAEALRGARAIGDESERSRALSALAGSLSGNLQKKLLAEALRGARAIGDESERSRALSALAGSLSGNLQEEVLAEALGAARAIRTEFYRSLSLLELAGSLSGNLQEEVLAEALGAARAIRTEFYRSLSLSALARSLSGELQQEALTEALKAAKAIGDGSERAIALSTLVGLLSGDDLQKEVLAEALGAGRAIDDESNRSMALSTLAGSLSDHDLQKEVLAEALEAARAIGDEFDVGQALAQIFAHCGENQLEDLVAEFSRSVAILDADVLRVITVRVPKVAARFAQDWLIALSLIRRGQLLEGVAALLPVLGGEKAAVEIAATIRETSQQWP